MSLGIKNFLVTNSVRRNALLTICFYAIARLIIGSADSGGPCGPGLDFILFLPLIPIIIFLLVTNVYKAFAVSATYTISVLLHLVAILWMLHSICS